MGVIFCAVCVYRVYVMLWSWIHKIAALHKGNGDVSVGVYKVQIL